jgi:hypothetical protein
LVVPDLRGPRPLPTGSLHPACLHRPPSSAKSRKCCNPAGDASPPCSARVQQFFRGNFDISPCTTTAARRRVSTRAKRPAIRPIRSPNCARHRSSSTLAPAATARSFWCPHKPRSSSGGRSTFGTDTPKITIYNCRTRPLLTGTRGGQSSARGIRNRMPECHHRPPLQPKVLVNDGFKLIGSSQFSQRHSGLDPSGPSISSRLRPAADHCAPTS